MKKSIVVDPAGCGCTDCIVRDSTPEDMLSEKQIIKMLNGKKIINRTSGPIRFNVEWDDYYLKVKIVNTDASYHVAIDKLNGSPVIEIPAY